MGVRGWVYVLSNKAMPGLVKIGFSTKDPSLRAEELNGTSLPHPFTLEYDVLVINPYELEQKIHDHIGEFREAKEFFKLTVSDAVAAVRKVLAIRIRSSPKDHS